MNSNSSAGLFALTAVAALAPCLADDVGMQLVPDPSGVLGIVNLNGSTRTDGRFFQSLGTNGRSCSSCHVAGQGMSFTPTGAQARFTQTQGHDPLFSEVDGANCRGATTGDAAAHSLILNSGLIRIGLTLPATAEFTISAVHDPYGCAIVPDPVNGQPTVSVYRRPLPATNLRFLSAVMFDGRETVKPLDKPLNDDGQTFLEHLVADLTHQATDATTGHAQATQAPTSTQLSQIVNFELGLFTAQSSDSQAGSLSIAHAQGAPRTCPRRATTPASTTPSARILLARRSTPRR